METSVQSDQEQLSCTVEEEWWRDFVFFCCCQVGRVWNRWCARVLCPVDKSSCCPLKVQCWKKAAMQRSSYLTRQAQPLASTDLLNIQNFRGKLFCFGFFFCVSMVLFIYLCLFHRKNAICSNSPRYKGVKRFSKLLCVCVCVCVSCLLTKYVFSKVWPFTFSLLCCNVFWTFEETLHQARFEMMQVFWRIHSVG